MLGGERSACVQPGEWTEHTAVWSAWPYHGDWGEALARVKDELEGFFRAVYDEGRGDTLRLLVRDEAARAEVEARLGDARPELHLAPYGDIWLRDTAPIFGRCPSGALRANCFGFNGWGGKYRMTGDEAVAGYVAEVAGARPERHALILEGGAVEPDGEGTVLTTRACLLNANRNPSCGETEIEAALRASLGAERVLWLGDGLINDHTDGHVDTIARFVAPARVVCMRPAPGVDPNAGRLDTIRSDLERMTDARGRRLEVVTIPSPGAVYGPSGALMPASYVNFYITNSRVIVPTYEVPQDDEAVEGIAALFPGREVIGRSARALLEGGGAFHCITQQQPIEAEVTDA